MSTSSDITLKQSLRRIDYPKCHREALNKIVELICGRATSIKNMDLALDLMAEFVFCEVDRRGQKRQQPFSPLQELQLVDILYEFFHSISDEALRNAVFLSLFTGTTAACRLGVLTKLSSIAIAIPSQSILIPAGAWMQQLGNLSQNSCKFAEGLVQDYFHFYKNSDERLKMLPVVCPQFAANFITSIAENYLNPEKKELRYPPESILHTITSWIADNPLLCVSAQQRPAPLPPGAIVMDATTPIAGLVRWCVLAPIFKIDNESYNSLHLALLNSIIELPVVIPPKAVYANNLTSPINPILKYFDDLKTKQELKLDQILTEKTLQLSLDRFAQLIQVIVSSNVMTGHVDELLYHLRVLPFNKLMSIVINTHKQNSVIVL